MIYLSHIALSFFSFLLSFGLVHFLRRIAPKLNLIDESGSETRKDHHGRPALVGGSAIIAASLIAAAVWFSTEQLNQLVPLIWGATLYTLLGIFDDAKNVPALSKLVLQIFIAFTVVIFFDFSLYNLGHINGYDVFSLGNLARSFTILCILAYINAFNMVDGLDGLAGGIAFISFLILGGIAFVGNLIALQDMLMILAMSTFGFLVLNMRSPLRRKALVFLGDGGSLSLAFSIAFCAIVLGNEYSADNSLPAPIIYAFILAYPIYDMITVTLRRFSAGSSIFAADTNHLHHLLKKRGLTVGKTSISLIILSSIYSLTGIILWLLHPPQKLCLGIWILMLFMHYILCWTLSRSVKQL